MTSDDATDSRLCALIRRKAERLDQERGAAGFKNHEVADAALVEAMALTNGTSAQVRQRLLSVVDEALHGPSWAEEPPKPPPDASPEEHAAYADDMEARAAAFRAEADMSRWVVAEARRRGAGPDTLMRDIFTKEEMAKMPRWLMRPAK